MADLPPQGVPPRVSDEREFNRLMRDEYLDPFLTGVVAAIAESGAATSEGAIAAVLGFVAWWKQAKDPDFDVEKVRKWASQIDIRQRVGFVRDIDRLGARAPIPGYRPVSGDTLDILERTIQESVGLIKTIPERYHSTLATRLVRSERAALGDNEATRKIVKEVGQVSGYVLRRITRDQSNKLMGALNIFRMKQAGFLHYRWSTSLDERVRDEHEEREGRIYPIDGGTGVIGDLHPGQAIQCRCVAIPHVEPDIF